MASIITNNSLLLFGLKLFWLFQITNMCYRASPVAQQVENLPAMEGDGFDPWVRRSPGERKGNPIQYSCLKNPTDRGVWWATVHEVERAGHC